MTFLNDILKIWIKNDRQHLLTACRDSRIAAQGVQPLVRNIVTQNSPDIQLSVVFGLIECTYGDYPV